MSDTFVLNQICEYSRRRSARVNVIYTTFEASQRAVKFEPQKYQKNDPRMMNSSMRIRARLRSVSWRAMDRNGPRDTPPQGGGRGGYLQDSLGTAAAP